MDQEQLRNLEAQCIQEHAPPCTAACPLHVDVRGVLAALSRDDFDAALQLLAKRLPFPDIIGRMCEQPCRPVCHRGELGGALNIAALERACADFGARKIPPRIPPRGKRVAVVGGGLSGVTVAFDLTRKGYSVTLFEATGRVGGSLWETDPATLPRDLLFAELDAALQGVDVHLNDPIDADRLTTLRADFDAIYLGVGLGPDAAFALELAQSVDSTTFATFPGCQLSASAPEHVEKVYAHLRERLPNVGLMLRCCGAPADWAGRTDLFTAALADFRADYECLGQPKVILACSTCYQMLKQHLPDVAIVSLWSLLDDIGLPKTARQIPVTALALHDPCTTRYESALQDSARNVLSTLGCPIEELPLSREKTECCSYGGLMWLANRDLAQTVVQRRIAQQPLDYVTYCAMCRDFFADQGKPTLHLLDLLYENDLPARAARPGPLFSQRHDNRARLKRRLLADLWEETVSEPETISLHLSDEVAARVDGRLILEDDIRQVIAYAERTGNRFRNPATGHFLAYHKPANVTYWVEYTPAETGFTIHNAYSHRMEIVIQPKS